jgi:hypothetical protein
MALLPGFRLQFPCKGFSFRAVSSFCSSHSASFLQLELCRYPERNGFLVDNKKLVLPLKPKYSRWLTI